MAVNTKNVIALIHMYGYIGKVNAVVPQTISMIAQDQMNLHLLETVMENIQVVYVMEINYGQMMAALPQEPLKYMLPAQEI